MSNALVVVSFSDGLKLYSQYQGSSDSFYPALFDSPDEAFMHSRHDKEGFNILTRTIELKNPEKVHVLNTYGGECDDYKAVACRITKQLRVEHTWLE